MQTDRDVNVAAMNSYLWATTASLSSQGQNLSVIRLSKLITNHAIKALAISLLSNLLTSIQIASASAGRVIWGRATDAITVRYFPGPETCSYA